MIRLALAILLMASPLAAEPCFAPQNGGGTVDYPPTWCPFTGTLTLVDGLPPGTTIEIDATVDGLTILDSGPGGMFGGNVAILEGTIHLAMTGTGELEGYTREIDAAAFWEVHTAPFPPGDGLFDAATMQLQGGVQGDPDFDMISLEAGNNFGLPSPGQVGLTELPGGDFNVDSFFDIQYRIQFMGAPGGILEGLAGITIWTRPWYLGEPWTPVEDGDWSLVKSLY